MRLAFAVFLIVLVAHAAALLRLKPQPVVQTGKDCTKPTAHSQAQGTSTSTKVSGSGCTPELRRDLVVLLDKVLGACETAAAMEECATPSDCMQLLGADKKGLLSQDLKEDVTLACKDSLTPSCPSVRAQVSALHDSFQRCTGCKDATTCTPSAAVAAQCSSSAKEADGVASGVASAFAEAFSSCQAGTRYAPKCADGSLLVDESFKTTVTALARDATSDEKSSFPLRDLLSMAGAGEGEGGHDSEEADEDEHDREHEHEPEEHESEDDDGENEDEEDDDGHMVEEGDFEEDGQ